MQAPRTLLRWLPQAAALAALAALLLDALPVPRSVAQELDAAPKEVLGDRSLAPHQVELLELAFKAASALPLEPHIKNRSRAQETVVSACLELDQPQRAQRYADGIANWRRGAGYAGIATWYAQRGDAASAKRFCTLASDLAARLEGEEVQGWHRDRILAGVARTQMLLGESEQAARIEEQLVSTEAAALQASRARLSNEAVFEAQLPALDAALGSGDFDQVRYALEACAELFQRFYPDPERRAQIEERIERGSERLPGQVRVELTLRLAAAAVEHEDPARSLELLEQAGPFLEALKQTPEISVPLQARAAGLRHRAGDREGARRAADAALSTFETERRRILDIDRAGALRPLAEAYHTLGDAAAALSIYRRAVEEGVHNPNSRPRAEDLVATCLSLARQGFEPDAALLERLREVAAELGDPW